jgi:hypothetical protein
MAIQGDRLFVRSYVARDFLQNAALFKTDKLVVWEYVSNGLQYVDPGTSPVVQVKLDSKRKSITISDNGRGMDWAGLKNFFVMHGENIDRKEGRPGRGMFGTGKSAAFGIADKLRIETTRGGRRSIVELTRASIDRMGSEDPIPVEIIEEEKPTSHENGTVIEITGVGPQNVLTQAERYSGGAATNPLNFHGYHVPFLFKHGTAILPGQGRRKFLAREPVSESLSAERLCPISHGVMALPKSWTPLELMSSR